MPQVVAVVGTVVGAISSAVGTVTGVLGAVLSGTAIGGGVTAFGFVASHAIVSAALTFGLSQVGSLFRPDPPPAQGSVSQVIVQADAAQPYVMGEGYVGGVERYHRAYGATLNSVPNPYLALVHVYSGGGPIEEITPQVDFAAVSSWYSGYLNTSTALGACPATALSPYWSGMPDWDSASKLSGYGAILWNCQFDRDGKRFASGLPVLGAYGKWVKAYDPRADSTRDGGSGSQRIDDETTWTWTENPALHAATYAYGRYQNGKRVLGIGLADTAIDWSIVAAWANTCDTNGWTIFGRVFEPGDRMANLRDICAAGGADPVILGSQLSFAYAAPRVALETVTEADLADADQSVVAMAEYRNRINTIIPKYRSPDHNWEMVDAAPVAVSSYVSEDGETRQQSWPFNLVKNVDQAAQLARYKIEDLRELQPIELKVGPRLRALRPGDCVQLDLPVLGLDTKAVILRRQRDPQSGACSWLLIGETDGKHAYALGMTGVAPPTPAIGQTAEDRDRLAAAAQAPAGWVRAQIQSSSTDPVSGLLTAADAGSDATITVAGHTRIYNSGSVSVSGGAITGLAYATTYYVYYDDYALAGGAVTFGATTVPEDGANSEANPGRHGVGNITTPASGAASTTGGGVYDLSAILAGISWSFP